MPTLRHLVQEVRHAIVIEASKLGVTDQCRIAIPLFFECQRVPVAGTRMVCDEVVSVLSISGRLLILRC